MRRLDGFDTVERRSRTGAALLEAIVAMTILAAVATTVVAIALESGRALARARETENEMRTASALLDAVALWPRADLDRHLGTRVQGPWLMDVNRATATLYDIVIADSASRREILRTELYRPLDAETSREEREHVQ